MSEFIEVFIEQEANSIPVNNISEINKFLPYYKNIINDNLAYLFAYFHFKYSSYSVIAFNNFVNSIF